MPATAWIFRNFNDRGLSLTKIMGLLLLTYFSWVLPQAGLGYSTGVVMLSLVMVSSLSLVVYYFRGFTIDIKRLIRIEVMFTVAFLLFAIIRAYRPEIYWTGGEKLMDMSFINMILRSSSFPPMDPWLSGEPMQYYYFGYLVAANLIKLSGVLPTIGFNLVVASMFALSATAAFGVGRNVTGSTLFGIIIMAFVVIFGNIAGFIQLLVILFFPAYYHVFSVPDAGILTRLSTFNYWPTSRVIPYTINEFPYFSFIQADVHAHMISIAFQLLMLALLLSLLHEGRRFNIQVLVVIALLLGFMFPLNSWDYPTYAVIFIMFLLAWRIRALSKVYKSKRFLDRAISLTPHELLKTIMLGAAVGISSIILYIPYYLNNGIVHQVKFVTYGQSELFFYLGVYSIMLFFIMIYAILRFYDLYYPDMTFIMAGLLTSVAAAYLTNIQILIIILPLIAMSLYCLIREEQPSQQFIHLLILSGALLSLFCEMFYIQDSFGVSSPEYIRYNTVFKIYVQIWIIWALAGGLSFFHIWKRLDMRSNSRTVFAAISIFLILAGLSYPVFATYSRADNFRGQPTLDGAAYLQRQYPNEFNAILWLNDLNGTPVVMQSPGNAYALNTHVTAFTGLPAVIGWPSHEKNWRNNAKTIDERWFDSHRVYTSNDIDEVDGILEKYHVDYIYVGGVEEERYGGKNARQVFEKNPAKFQLVYSNPNVHIYKVVRRDA